MKILNRFGNACRYKFGDLVKYNEQVYIVIDAQWIGNSTGFWEIFLKDKYDGHTLSVFRTSKLKKIGEINEKTNHN